MSETDLFKLMLTKQLELQTEKMKDGDPRVLAGAARQDFMRWNAFALEDEIHEAMAEVAWKPWAKADFINRDLFIKEMVDAFHFFMNMLLAASAHMEPAEIADQFFDLYMEKNAINAKRQDDGYTGQDKCLQCGRDRATTAVAETIMKDGLPIRVISYCPCGNSYPPQFITGS